MFSHVKSSLFLQVVIALILGCLFGHFFPDIAKNFQVLGDSFVRLIKMLIAPLIFCVIVMGIYNSGNLKKAGKVGLKTIIYFEIMTTLALVLGIAVAYWLKPGHGMDIDLSTLDASSLSKYQENMHSVTSISDFFLNMIPQTAIGAFTGSDILQVVLLSILFGISLSLLPGDVKAPVASFIDKVSQVIFKMMSIIVKLAPIGVFGAISFTVAKFGINTLFNLGYLVIIYYLTVIFFVVIILGAILKLCGFNIFKLIRYFKEEISIVFGTSSSDSVLPQVMYKLKKLGIRDTTVSLVVPSGYSFNLDGFSIYLTLAVVFIAQATGVNLSFHDLLVILLITLFTSKGAHGIPASAIVVLAATLSSFPIIPAIGLVLILSVDWIIGIIRAASNLVGNCVATLVIATWEKDIDRVQAHKMLDDPEFAKSQLVIKINDENDNFDILPSSSHK
ncbi:C4-dicarboxylate transporter DctA [Acinetobacter puyangensis]|uniref:Aerobic C4-dicarboxylate transport protein n=1 Tax=Acinetobacter puyangensis TaxID=1096779 RepID=A0A240E3F2_9GAMM|nr:C4-dicarboxylate transporter DctA [Acinetobacter puyangensis]SNX43298.1 aerobic C4-dicarboxylate transport protein [Acinetobacter puyangensis]